VPEKCDAVIGGGTVHMSRHYIRYILIQAQIFGQVEIIGSWVRVDEVWTMALRIDHSSATLNSLYFG
jgi:hypothetical protein